VAPGLKRRARAYTLRIELVLLRFGLAPHMV
jgi:hypothetical protein